MEAGTIPPDTHNMAKAISDLAEKVGECVADIRHLAEKVGGAESQLREGAERMVGIERSSDELRQSVEDGFARIDGQADDITELKRVTVVNRVGARIFTHKFVTTGVTAGITAGVTYWLTH